MLQGLKGAQQRYVESAMQSKELLASTTLSTEQYFYRTRPASLSSSDYSVMGPLNFFVTQLLDSLHLIDRLIASFTLRSVNESHVSPFSCLVIDASRDEISVATNDDMEDEFSLRVRIASHALLNILRKTQLSTSYSSSWTPSLSFPLRTSAPNSTLFFYQSSSTFSAYLRP